jgi:hypothetical protein
MENFTSQKRVNFRISSHVFQLTTMSMGTDLEFNWWLVLLILFSPEPLLRKTWQWSYGIKGRGSFPEGLSNTAPRRPVFGYI